MGADQRIRRKMIWLSAALALLLLLGSCSSPGWVWSGDPVGCGCAVEYDCTSTIVQDAVSPSGAHAKVITQRCTYNKHDQPIISTEVFVDHIPEWNKDVTVDQHGRYSGPSAFNTWNDPKNPEAPHVNVDWLADNELLVTYSGAVGHMCSQLQQINVHCTERGFTPPQR